MKSWPVDPRDDKMKHIGDRMRLGGHAAVSNILHVKSWPEGFGRLGLGYLETRGDLGNNEPPISPEEATQMIQKVWEAGGIPDRFKM